MAKVLCTCGKVCSGKSTYAYELSRKNRAVVLSVDEIMLSLFGQHCGDMHDTYVERVQNYFYGKALELVESGIDVIFDWGFWTKAERDFARDYFTSRGIGYELHYIDVCDTVWHERIDRRNQAVLDGKVSAYYIDGNIAEKFNSIFEKPNPDEVDVVIKVD